MKKYPKFLVASAALVLLSSCGGNAAEKDTYTYKSYTSALATNWNPCTWETNSDDSVLSYLSEGLVSLEAKDTENGVYQWANGMATSVEDVTKTSVDKLVKYGVFADEAAANAYIAKLDSDNPGQYVYKVTLRDGLKWQDGTEINADTFVDSMETLLNPKALNYRANLYVAGESAIAGGSSYYYAGSSVMLENYTNKLVTSTDDLELKDGAYVSKATGGKVVIALGTALSYLSSNSLADYVEYYGSTYFDTDTWAKLLGLADDDGNVNLTPESLGLLQTFLTNSTAWGESADYFICYLLVKKTFPEVAFDDTVGIYKVDDHSFCYVMNTPLDRSQTLVSFSSTWIVHEGLYEQCLDKSSTPWTSTYGTSVETSMSYGPYKLVSLQAEKQMKFEQNENWWGFEKTSDGSLTSTTEFEVNGARQKQYQATSVVIDVLEDAAAKQQFLKGELSEYSPTASELSDYTLSDALYQVDDTYTMSLFFNTNVDALKKMDVSEGNTNSVVLSNANFRKAFSLAIDRAEFVENTAAYKPAYSLMNDLYYYDVWNNPESSYRASEPAMQAICNLYGVEWGEGKAYATLKDAYKSITGLNLTEAKALMKKACEELVAAGLYTAGEAIKIRLAWSAGALSTDDNALIASLQKFINSAAEGSGFGSITFEGVGSISNPSRYAAVPAGSYAVGYGAWGGAAFYPFRNMQVYCDPDQYSINEAADWDPTSETLKIEFEYNGEKFSDEMTWQAWSGALTGSGKYANANNEIKLRITAVMEEEYLNKYYRIPLCSTTSAFLLSYQVAYFTDTYNIMYGFGGFRLLKFNYSDKEWSEFIKSQGGELDYE